MKQVAFISLLLGGWLLLGAPYQDPKPPKLNAVDDRASAKPRSNSQAIFYKAPKLLATGAVSTDWPNFLGSSHQPASDETRILKQFGSKGPALVWEMEKGTGYSSPSIQGEYLVYMYRRDDEEIVDCLHPETGERYWKYSYATDFEDRYGYNNGPRATAVIDGDRVYAYGAKGELHCLLLATGQILWKRNIAVEFKVPQDFFGVSASPLLEGNSLILNIGAPGGPSVAAFEKHNGHMLWGAGDKWGPSYATPVAADVHGNRKILVFAGGESNPPVGGLLVLDPQNGTLDFRYSWRSRSYESVNASNPLVARNHVLISASYRAGAALLEIEKSGGYREVWKNQDFDLHWTTAVYEDGYYYAFAGRNEPDAKLMCVNAESGETVWSKVLEWEETISLQGETRKINASPLRGNLLKVDGRYLALGEYGHLLWLDLSPQGVQILERARLFLARQTWSPPVLSRGLLYINQNTRSIDPVKGPRLLCYDLRGQ